MSNTPNPFENSPYIPPPPHSDPFATPQITPSPHSPPPPTHPAAAPGLYHGSPPPIERYASPNMVQHGPSPQPIDYLGAHYHPDTGLSPPIHHTNSIPSLSPPPSISPRPYSGYELQDNGPVAAQDDLGDIPLLRRGPSQMTMNLSMNPPFSPSGTPAPDHMFPGGFVMSDGTGAQGYDDDEPENNIRYGRIPQRVPRRYKTTKKVE